MAKQMIANCYICPGVGGRMGAGILLICKGSN